ncbi:MAG: PDZ domain-containing protein [Patescibacteria group bacterium]|nr:PDZ domain-containing protein [Patescibacteria group bacterium]
MPKEFFSGLGRSIFLIFVAASCGGLAGGAAGFYASSFDYGGTLDLEQRIRESLESRNASSTVSVIKVERPSLSTIVPSIFFKRGGSAVAGVYRAPANKVAGAVLEDTALLGQAVALTSDGWFVTPAETLEGLKSNEAILWYDRKAYPVEKGIMDNLDGVAFVKVNARDVPVFSFSRVQDLAIGAELWSEKRPSEYAPSVATDLNFNAAPNSRMTSETSARRIGMSGVALAGDMGAPVWNDEGQLVGVVESGVGEQLRLIPASLIASSLPSLLSDGQVRHAYLGVVTMDLASAKRLDVAEDEARYGALISDDKKINRVGVAKDSPAAKAGLKNGDVILRVERDILDGTTDLGEILSEYKPGSEVTLRILREKQDLDIKVSLGSIITSETLK